MESKQKNIDQLFKDRLKDYVVNLSDENNSWLLMQHLIQSKKKKRFFLRKITLSFLTLIMLFGIFFVIKHNSNNTPLKENTKKNSKVLQKKLLTSYHDSLDVKNKNNLNLISSNKKILPNSMKKTSNLFNKNKVLSSETSVNTQENDKIEVGTMNENKSKTIFSESITEYKHSKENKPNMKFKILPSTVNSKYAEYAPVINADATMMFFTSRRAIKMDNEKEIKDKENIFFTRYNKEKKQWEEATLAPFPINKLGNFNSAVALSHDGQKLFIYRDDKYGNGDIYESMLNGNEWSEPKRLPEPINSQFHESTISFSPDGQTIYFTSNRKGGVGGMDIWYCQKQKNGHWGKAQNIGTPINTIADEDGVFMHPDGKTLYFSSRREGEKGGYDVYYSVFENNKWSEPKNLGEKINTIYDDVYFVMSASGKRAFYASRSDTGLGEKDIVEITFHNENTKEKGPQLTLFKGKVLDKQNQFPIEANIELYDVEINELITQINSNKVNGEFMISLPAGKNYAINIQKQGYLFYSENFNIPDSADYNEVNKTILLDKLTSGAKIVLKNIFYDYDKATLREESKTELDNLYKLLIENPKLKLELSAHTDTRGNELYNEQLSQKRAQTCVDYLINKGISKERLFAKGYGEKFPIISDEEIKKLNSESDKENAHQQNRRTEIKIIEN